MAARLSIPTSGTFVSPFVPLVLISPSQPRKTTAAFSRLYAPPSFSLLARPISLAPPSFPLSSSRSFYLSISSDLSPSPHSPSPSPSLSTPPQHPSPRAARCARVGGNTVQLLPSRSFARSFLSVIPAVRFRTLSRARLSALHSSLFPAVQLQPASLASSRDYPATEETTHVWCALPLSRSHITALLLIQRYFMQILGTEFRSALQCRPPFSRKIAGLSVSLNSSHSRKTRQDVAIVNPNEEKKREVSIK